LAGNLSKLEQRHFFTRSDTPPTLFVEDHVTPSARTLPKPLCLLSVLLTLLVCQSSASGQLPKQPDQSKPKAATIPAQIELLETKYRFETNGDSRKEVHTRVRINSELGVRQFGLLHFDFNRSFQTVELSLVRITHSSGGIADILPSAITDNPNPAVVDAPAYQDVRVKSVRVLGLAPGDLLEYRVITTTHDPLAPNFWLEHSFDRSGIVAEERFEIDLPASRKVQLHVATQYPYTIDESENSRDARVVYRWIQPKPKIPAPAGPSAPIESKVSELSSVSSSSESDIALTTFAGWSNLSIALARSLHDPMSANSKISAKAQELTGSSSTPADQLSAIYDFVSKNVRTLDLPPGSTGFQLRPAEEILASGSATPTEKCALLSALAWAVHIPSAPALAAAATYSQRDLALPSKFTHALVVSRLEKSSVWLDPAIEVAPFGAISTALRGKPALLLGPSSDIQFFENLPASLPYPSVQKVAVDSSIDATGTLKARVKYTMRGDNELLLRVAFHQTPKEKWRDVAQLLAISDGFRGEISNVSASDPYLTKEPFQVEYEISQLKFVDWTKKPVRIPALLPSPGLPDAPTAADLAAGKQSIDLGTPLEIELNATVGLPAGVTAQLPTGTSIERDYATFSSKYGRLNAEGPAVSSSITATRKLHFLLSEIPATRATDLNTFLHAIQSDQGQLFTLTRPSP
jgi:hypothetical protein